MRKTILALACASLILTPGAMAQQAEEEKHGYCPKTNISGSVNDCLVCHTKTKSFRLKEPDPDEIYRYPVSNMFLDEGQKPRMGYLFIRSIDSGNVFQFFRYLTQHSIDYAVLELHSPGGNLLDAWRVVGLMIDWETSRPHRVVETRVYGFAASAGFLITISGTIGLRIASPVCELKWHELWTFKMFSISTPSSSEEEA